PPPPPVLPIPPPLRKKLSPTVERESEGTVRARFSNVISPRSGDQVIAGGEARVAHAGGQGVHPVAPGRPGRVSPAVQDQVARQYARVHAAVHVQAGGDAIVGWE